MEQCNTGTRAHIYAHTHVHTHMHTDAHTHIHACNAGTRTHMHVQHTHTTYTCTHIHTRHARTYTCMSTHLGWSAWETDYVNIHSNLLFLLFCPPRSILKVSSCGFSHFLLRPSAPSVSGCCCNGVFSSVVCLPVGIGSALVLFCPVALLDVLTASGSFSHHLGFWDFFHGPLLLPWIIACAAMVAILPTGWTQEHRLVTQPQ